jgi:HTH-type transcriptional regulator, sugar sensing transcriptional regulator
MNIDIQNDIPYFLDLDLTEREAKLYITLLLQKSFTANELKKVADIPSTKVYDVLQKMVKRGIVVERPFDNVKYYEAVDPRIAFMRVIERYKNDFNQELERKSKTVETLIQKLTPVYDENKDQFNPLDFIEIIKDEDLIQKKFIQAFLEGKYEALTFVKGPFLGMKPHLLKEQLEAQKIFFERGGKSKGIYDAQDLKKEPWLRDALKEMAEKGEELRVVDSLPSKMMVMDAKLVIFPLKQGTNQKDMFTVVCIEHAQHAKACKLLFDLLWDVGKTYEEFELEYSSQLAEKT